MVYKPRKASGRLKAMADGILLCSVIKELSEAWKNVWKIGCISKANAVVPLQAQFGYIISKLEYIVCETLCP